MLASLPGEAAISAREALAVTLQGGTGPVAAGYAAGRARRLPQDLYTALRGLQSAS